MLKYALFAFFACFLLNNLRAQDLTETLNLLVPNVSILALEDTNHRADTGSKTEKTFFVIAYAKANWYRAQEICSYQGFALASVQSAAENYQLVRSLREAGLLSHGESYWLGGSKLSGVSRWVWFNVGRPIAYKNWEEGQPDNFRNAEKCLEMKSSGQWNDYPCDREIFFICENRCPLTSYDVPIQKK